MNKESYCKNLECKNHGVSYQYHIVLDIDGVDVYLEINICSNCYTNVKKNY